MNVVSTTDTPEQVAAALEAHGFEVIPEPTAAPVADPAAPPSAAPPDANTPSGSSQTAGEPDTPPTEPASGKKGKGLQSRFDELTRKTYQEKGRADELQRQLDLLKAQISGKPAEPVAPPVEAVSLEPQRPARPKKPRVSEFDTTEEYEAADAAYDEALVTYEDKLAEYNRQTAIREFQQQQQQEQAKAAMEAIHDAGRAKHTDYDAVVFNDDVQITGAMLDTIAESDNPAEILYWWGSHPEDAKAFVEATSYNNPSQALVANRNAVRAVGFIQRQLAGDPAPAGQPVPPTAPKPAPKPSTSAPAPIAPLRGSSGTPAPVDPLRVIGQNGWTAAKERDLMRPGRR